MNYSGMREELTEAEEITVLDIINTEFKNLKAEQVVTAFKMNASGKYWKAVIAYQTFSPFFVGDVLGKYKEWLRKDNLKPKAYIEPSHQIGNELDPIAEMEKAFKFIEKVYKEQKIFPIIANWSDAFLYAEENGLINLSLDEKTNLKVAVLNEIKSKQLQTRLDTGIKGSVTEFGKGNVKVQCRKKALTNYFKK